MTVTVNLRKMLHRKTPEYMTPLATGNTVAGGFMLSDRDGFLEDNDCVYVGGTSSIWNYSGDEDAYMQLPNSGATGTFGAGAAGALRPIFAPGGASSSTATAGTTTTLTTSLAFTRNLVGTVLRVIAGTGIGYQGYITKNTLSTNSVITVSPASPVAFDATTVFQVMSGSVWFFCPGAGTVGFSVYDRATNTWTARSVTNIPTPFGTDAVLVSTAGPTSNAGQGFVNATAVAGASTTLTDLAKTWPVNGWTNSQVRIISGMGVGQIRTIASNTSTVLTVSAAWTVTPDATSVYRIEGNDDFMYLIGNNAVTMYRYSISANAWTVLAPTAARSAPAGAGASLAWIDQVSGAEWTDGTYGLHYSTTLIRQAGRYLYSLRGGASSALDVYDIAANTWISTVAYGGQMETFTTGTSSVDVSGRIYIQKDATGRVYQFNVAENALKPFAANPVPQGAALAGGKLFITTFSEGATKIRFLYMLSNTRSELVRWMII